MLSNKDIEIYNDDQIKTKSNLKIALYNDNVETLDKNNNLVDNKVNYNIYNNQLANITNIMVNYDFIDDNISENKKIDLDIEITFFVR
jgi:hypothetical protein